MLYQGLGTVSYLLLYPLVPSTKKFSVNISGMNDMNDLTGLFPQPEFWVAIHTQYKSLKPIFPTWIGLPVSQPGMNPQLEQRKGSWMLEGGSLRSSCPGR